MTLDIPTACRFNLLAVIALTLALGGCAGHSDFMTKVPQGAAPIAPASDRATIVFVRDSGFGFAVNFSIIDQTGNFLGDAVAQSHFALLLPPGRYFFVARGGENTDAVEADVAAGNLYYVRVISRFGAFLARVELHPVKPGDKDWRSLAAWLAHTDHLTPLIPKVATSVSESPLPDWASKTWLSLSPRDQAEHTLAPSDGRPFALSPPTAPSRTVEASF